MKTNIEAKSKFNIKLLAGNNVTLVEANGYDSEIFVPQIINGRIALVNIIPNRRCCQPQASRIKSAISNSAVHPKEHVNHNGIVKVSNFRVPGGQEQHKNVETKAAPLAFSTPIINSKHRHHHGGKKRNQLQEVTKTTKAILKQNNNNENWTLTPEIIREAAPNAGLHGTILQLPSPSKSVKFSRNPSREESITRDMNVGENGGDSRGGRGIGGGGGDVGGGGGGKAEYSIRTPSPTSTPLSSRALSAIQTASLNNVRSHTVNRKPSNRSTKVNEIGTDKPNCIGNDISNNSLIQSPLSFASNNKNCSPETKWRKVITPVRTYAHKTSRKILSPTDIAVLETAAAAERLAAANKVIPSYMINPTKGKKGTHRIEIRLKFNGSKVNRHQNYFLKLLKFGSAQETFSI